MRKHVSAWYVLCSEVHGDTRTLDCRVRARGRYVLGGMSVSVSRGQRGRRCVGMQCGGGRCACVRVPTLRW